MQKIWMISLCTIIASCATQPEPKVNVLTDANSEIVVTPPNCPDWTSKNHVFQPELKSSFYGCATVTNFGKMIDDPMDMISGKSTHYYDGQNTANAVNTYRTPTAATSSTTAQ